MGPGRRGVLGKRGSLPRRSSPRPVLRVAASGRRCRTERYVPPDPAAHSRCLQTVPQPRAAGPWGPRPVREAESGTPAPPSTSDPKRPQASPSSGPGSLPKTRRGQRAASSHGISLPSAKVEDEGSQPLANNARFIFFPVFFGTCACPDVLLRWQEGSLRSRGQSTVWRSPGSRDFWGLGAVAPARARGHLLTLSALEPSGFLVPKHARDLMVLALGEPNKLFWCVGGIPIFNSQVVEKL